MRRILASLFVIIAVVGMGVFATGAYFTDTVTQSNLTFRTDSADLKLGFCIGGVGAYCGNATADMDSFDYAGIDVAIGPGINDNEDCMVFENTGDYDLNLTGGIASYSQSTVGGTSTTDSMDRAFLVKAEIANSSCQAVGSVVFPMQTLYQADLAGHQSFGSLAPGGRLYVIWSNAWDSTGDQSALQNGWILIDVSMTGKTV